MKCNQIRGFSLIEILITVVILAIITSVAVPTYQSAVRKARRTDGRNALLALQVNQEKFRASCLQYASETGSVDTCSSGKYMLKGSSTSPEGYYSVAILAGTASATGYTVVARATGAQIGDKDCSTITLEVNNANPEGVYTPADCW